MTRKIYLREFVLIQRNVEQNRSNITPRKIYLMLLNWGFSLKGSNDGDIKKMFQDYFTYFENIDTDNYAFEASWYDFEELIDIDLLNNQVINFDNVVVVVRDILWEIIAFKTDRDCKVLPIDNLRLLTNSDKNALFFCCDVCGYTENIEGEKITVNEILYPATMSQIIRNNIAPCRF